ncbi:helix-turn-helix domain-containing protein [Pseudomonas extremaustralis]|uniref:helix-turn-helix domain-containing protein n=1 Tax=Pseudomonas extremaustralis TaxID=359110 RepID=UPI00099DE700|nr:LysR family transcriptional regulator [Pseudomonas extremaustralis]
MIPCSTIGQWAVLLTVVQEGSLSAAAEVLHRNQSSVSYAVAQLRDALGISPVETKGQRTVLTVVGSALLADVVLLIDEFVRLETRSQDICKGDPMRVRVVFDALFPRCRLFEASSRSI